MKTTFLILFFSLAGIILSCTKDVKIDIPKPSPLLVVNSLFNPDSSWRVYIGTNRNLKDTSSSSYISNANVSVYEGSNEIKLYYVGDGYYGSPLKPKVGVLYTLEASAPGYTLVEASDSIPESFSVTSYDLDTVPVAISPPNYFGTIDACRLQLSFDNIAQGMYGQVQVLSYNKDELYCYTISDSTLAKLQRIPWVSDSLIAKLSMIKGIPILSKTGLQNKVKEVTGDNSIGYRVFDFAERTECKTYVSELFQAASLYALQPPFYNIMEDFHSAFIDNSLGQHVEGILLYPDHYVFTAIWNSEIWLRFFTLSKAAFQFKTTYVKQQLNRENPFAQPVQVFNNIKNGLGIFAGYQAGEVRIY